MLSCRKIRLLRKARPLHLAGLLSRNDTVPCGKSPTISERGNGLRGWAASARAPCRRQDRRDRRRARSQDRARSGMARAPRQRRGRGSRRLTEKPADPTRQSKPTSTPTAWPTLEPRYAFTPLPHHDGQPSAAREVPDPRAAAGGVSAALSACAQAGRRNLPRAQTRAPLTCAECSGRNALARCRSCAQGRARDGGHRRAERLRAQSRSGVEGADVERVEARKPTSADGVLRVSPAAGGRPR